MRTPRSGRKGIGEGRPSDGGGGGAVGGRRLKGGRRRGGGEGKEEGDGEGAVTSEAHTASIPVAAIC